jgi:hypothetical protein
MIEDWALKAIIGLMIGVLFGLLVGLRQIMLMDRKIEHLLERVEKEERQILRRRTPARAKRKKKR